MPRLLALSLLTLCLTALGARAQAPQPPRPSPTDPRLAVCHLQPASGSACRGVVRFQQVEGGVRVTGEVSGLSPGKHGFHIHELGDLSAPDGSSAGGHFDPEGHPHAGPGAPRRHAGDLGNLEADAQGKARYEATIPGLVLSGGKASILGRSLVVHEKPDDLTTQPSGGAGARIAVGVIGVAADTTPPVITVLAPKEGVKLNANPVNVVVQVTDDIGVVGVTIAGSPAAPDPSGPGRWKLALTATRGPNKVAIVARDAGGNQASAGVGFSFNDKPPEVQADALIVVTGKVDDLTCTLTINGQKVAYDPKTGAYSARVTADPQQPSRVTIVATDEWGNTRTELKNLR